MKNDDSVNRLKELAEKMRQEKYEDKRDIKDIVLFVLTFLLHLCVGFGWMMLMLLIISFVSLGYLHMKVKSMVTVSVCFAVLCGGYYIFKLIHSKKK